MHCTDTSGKLPAIRLDDELIALALELKPIIESIEDEGDILLRVQHRWVSAISQTRRWFRKKRKAS